MKRSKRVAKIRRGAGSGAGGTASPPSVKPQTQANRKKSKGKQKSLSLMALGEESRYAVLERLRTQYRPLKAPVTMRVDADVLAWFKKDGRRYQTRINLALRKVMAQEMKQEEGTDSVPILSETHKQESIRRPRGKVRFEGRS